MFWGLTIKTGRRYSQEVEKDFHISSAAIDADHEEEIKLYIVHENEELLVCVLQKGKVNQVGLDLNFSQGDKFHLIAKGKTATISLCGYLFKEMEDDDDENDLEEQEIEDLRLKLQNNKKGKKKQIAAGDNDEEDGSGEEDEEYGDISMSGLEEDSEDDEEDDDDDDDDDDEEDEDEDDEDEDDDEENQDEDDKDDEKFLKDEPVKKKAKLEKTPVAQNGVAVKPQTTPEKKDKKKEQKNAKKQNENQKKPQQAAATPAPGGEKTLSGGVKIQDLIIGKGPEAKPGKQAIVYYEGRLKSNNKVFDAKKSGKGLKFALGKGEVIKGWDIGVAGMKSGGKRRIICPPHMAYGARGSPPVIPPNSTLIFEVELKGVN